MNNKKNRLKEALTENFNLVGLAGTAALSAAFLSPIPLLMGVVAEAAYLLFVPDSSWYQKRLTAKFDSEVGERRNKLKAQVFPQITPRVQERFSRLETIRSQITVQQPGMEKQDWFRQVLRKLDYLLEKFLLFASKEAQFRTYLAGVYDEIVEPERGGGGGSKDSGRRSEQRRNQRREWIADMAERPNVTIRVMPGGKDAGRGQAGGETSGPPLPAGVPDGPGRQSERWIHSTVQAIQAQYDEDVTEIEQSRDAEQEESTRAVLDKRIEVLQQRKEYVGKIGRILTNLGHQMELLEDSFGLINDQIRARSPEQVLADIEGVVYQTDSMTKLLDELAPYDQELDRLAA